jgi:flagellar hook-length control protein FliK
VRLRLHPAELGSLRIDVKVLEGVLTAHLQAETPEARTALVDNLPVLRERLAEQGIRIDKFDVDLRDHSDRQPQQSQGHERRADRPTSERIKTTRPSTDRETPRGPIVRGTSGANGLNVVV